MVRLSYSSNGSCYEEVTIRFEDPNKHVTLEGKALVDMLACMGYDTQFSVDEFSLGTIVNISPHRNNIDWDLFEDVDVHINQHTIEDIEVESGKPMEVGDEEESNSTHMSVGFEKIGDDKYDLLYICLSCYLLSN
jgi:hypothetical protein